MSVYQLKRIQALGVACLASVLLFSVASVAHAATIVTQVPANAGIGDTFILPIGIATNGEQVNAFEGNVTYPQDLLLVREVRTGNSVVSFWVEEPNDISGSVRFAGVIPGGYTGANGKLFDIVFEAKHSGVVRFTLTNAQALLNDGQGTAVSLTLSAAGFAIGVPGTGKSVPEASATDHTPPVPFVPQLGTSPALFGGSTFVAFATADKESGVDHFEVAERVGFQVHSYEKLSWRISVNPELLRDQAQRSYIYVKAVDKAGNMQVAVLSPARLPFYFNVNVLAGILIVLVALSLALRAYVLSRKHSTKVL